MGVFEIVFDEPAWPDIAGSAPLFTVVAGTMLIGGMQSGKSSVALRVEHNGVVALAECSLDHLEMFVKACRAREQYLIGTGEVDA